MQGRGRAFVLYWASLVRCAPAAVLLPAQAPSYVMNLQQIIAAVIVVAIVVGCRHLLWAIIRFSIIAPRRARGWQGRLRKPRIGEIESKWSVQMPRALESFFKSKVVERFGFYLAPAGADRSRWCYIARFIPMTARDLAEWLAITKVPGIPIALDADKGTYYLPFEPLRPGQSPAVLLRAGGRKAKDTEVASSVEQFVQYQPMEVSDEDAG
jgi:hypothetical protein